MIMWILDKIRGKVEKPKVQEKPDDIGMTKQQKEIAEKVGSVYRKVSKNLLAREEQEILLETLQKRFLQKTRLYVSKNAMRRVGYKYKAVVGVKWQDVQKKLEANPDKIWSLNEMERTGGEPNVFSYDEKTGEYIFMDWSAESPIGRRNCVYDREAEEYLKKNRSNDTWRGNAVDMAAEMGIELLSANEYKELQSKGEFDKDTTSWVKAPIYERKRGIALHGARGGDEVVVREFSAIHHWVQRSFRGSLRV